jgi:hypothetical protein
MFAPHVRNPAFTLGVGELRRRGTRSVRVRQNQVMKKSAGVNLPVRFLRRIIGELFKPFADAGVFQAFAVAFAANGRPFPCRSPAETCRPGCKTALRATAMSQPQVSRPQRFPSWSRAGFGNADHRHAKVSPVLPWLEATGKSSCRQDHRWLRRRPVRQNGQQS